MMLSTTLFPLRMPVVAIKNLRPIGNCLYMDTLDAKAKARTLMLAVNPSQRSDLRVSNPANIKYYRNFRPCALGVRIE